MANHRTKFVFITGGVISLIACRLGTQLRKQILEGVEGLEEWLQIRFVLLMANTAAGLIA